MNATDSEDTLAVQSGTLTPAEAQSLLMRVNPNAWTELQGQWTGVAVAVQELNPKQWLLQAENSLCVATLGGQGRAPSVRASGQHAQLLTTMGQAELRRTQGWMTVHAGGYVTEQGLYRLVLGRSGAGKSTRVMGCVLEGRPFIGEDLVWLRSTDLHLVPRDTAVRLLPDALIRLSASYRLQATRDSDGKYRVPLEGLGITPAAPGPLHDIEVLLGRQAQPGQTPATAGAGGFAGAVADKRLSLLQALWEALGRPFMPQAQRETERAIQRLLQVPAMLLLRTPQGQLLAV